MKKKRSCLLSGSLVLVSPVLLSGLAPQSASADFLGVNWEYVFSFLPWLKDYIFSFFSSYYAKEIVNYDLAEKVKEIVEGIAPNCNKWVFRPLDHFYGEGRWWTQYWKKSGTCTSYFSIIKYTFYIEIVRKIIDGVPRLIFCADFCNSFYVENEEDLKKVKNFMNSLHIAAIDIAELSSKYSSSMLNVYLDLNDRSKWVINWPSNFTPELELEDKKCKVSKLVYDILNSKILVYSQDYKSGAEPLSLDREKLDNICKDILGQIEKFKFGLLQKAKEKIEEKLKTMSLEYNDDRGSFEGEIKVGKAKVPVNLKAVVCKGSVVCGLFVCEGNEELVSFVSFDEKSEKKISSFISNFEYFLGKVEALEKSNLLAKEDIGDNEIVLDTKNIVKYAFTCKNGEEKEKTFSRMRYELKSDKLTIASYIDGKRSFHVYDFKKKEDREKFDKIINVLIDKKVPSVFEKQFSQLDEPKNSY